MSEEDITVILNATDNASATISQAADSIDESIGQIQNSTSGLGTAYDNAASSTDQINTAYGYTSDAADSAANSTSSLSDSISSLGSSALSSAMGAEQLQMSQARLDSANLTVQKDTAAVQTAQDAYNTAVANYGPNSTQAQTAAGNLQTAHETLKAAQERAEAEQNRYNLLLAGDALKAFDTVKGSISGLSDVLGGLPDVDNLAEEGTTGVADSMDTLNMSLGVVGLIISLGTVIYEAYQNCEPFRNAINDIAGVLENAFKVAANDVYTALSDLWNDILAPIATFLEGAFETAASGASDIVNGFKTAVNDIYGALNDLWNDILVPVADFLEGAFLTAVNVVMTPINDLVGAVKTVSNIGSSIGGVFGGIGKALGLQEGGIIEQPTLAVVGEAGPEAVVPLNQSFGDVLAGLGSTGASPAAPASSSPGSQPINVTLNTTLQIGSLGTNASLQDIVDGITDALNRGVAQPMVYALNRQISQQQARRG